jgi:acyl-CoA synthetase (AMP-forming)/AMP-acid ligase II
MGDASLEVSEVVDALRWQLPRLAKLKRIDEDSRVSVARVLADQAAAIPDRTFFLWHEKAFSYREADVRVNQVLTALVSAGVRTGQHVGVLMSNGPDYLTVVTAINRMGAVGVLLNAGARGKSLDHAILTARVEVLVADGPLAAEAERALPGHVFLLGRPGEAAPEGVTDLDTLIDPAITTAPAGIPINQGKARDLAFLLFTSGTTGLPRAARVTNRRWALAALGGAAACRLTWKDTVYCCLPLHHATGLLIAVGGALVSGARLALESRFSPETFWPDVRRYGATVVFYVGEVCRYLVAAPVNPGEDRHPVRLFAGNGMSREVWERLERRFGGVQVLEFYSSTEGNLALTNLSGEKRGAVGRPLPGTAELALVRYDAEQGAPLRSKSGRLERVGAGEVGLLLARISDEHPLARFDGYLDPAATENKTVHDALERGDTWFNTGDLLRRDEDGDYWFVDRIGDTFRWKGENVSTEQVAQVLGEASFVAIAVVYGVVLPGREGRAGMAAIELAPGAAFDGQALFSLVDAHLPPAARPRFVRVVAAIEITSTFKPVKRTLRDEGADPSRLPGPLYFYDEPARAYSPLDPATYASLIGDSARPS